MISMRSSGVNAAAGAGAATTDAAAAAGAPSFAFISSSGRLFEFAVYERGEPCGGRSISLVVCGRKHGEVHK